jgi:hypothetical protein
MIEHTLVLCLQVCLRFGSSQRLLWPPLAAGPPPGEVPLQPLLEVLKPDNLVALFAAVLLEQRVLLRVRGCRCCKGICMQLCSFQNAECEVRQPGGAVCCCAAGAARAAAGEGLANLAYALPVLQEELHETM